MHELSPMKAFIASLEKLLGRDRVLHTPAARMAYECDALTIAKHRPDVVVLPESTQEVSAVCKLAHATGVAVVPRGAGTGLSGGALAADGGVMIATARMNRILAVDVPNRRAVVQPGLVNTPLSEAVRSEGLGFAPDPSSQFACTLGGNVAENAGGPHTLKYGVTTNHVLGLTVVRSDGSIVTLGGTAEGLPGYDLVGLFVGSEGTLGVATEIVVKLVALPEAVRTMLAVFDSIAHASDAVGALIRSGIVPAALEMMDNLVIRAVEAAYGFGFPLDAAAVLIVELDGLAAGLDRQAVRASDILKASGAREVRLAKDEADRQLLWKSRKRAVGALGRYAPAHATQDGVIPPSKLPEVLAQIARIADRYRIRIANVFHAGDGNLHPIALFDDRDEDEIRRVIAAGGEILRLCASLGGSITGEHGIGIEKLAHMELLFGPDDLFIQDAIRRIWDPEGLMNPGKLLPQRACGEVARFSGATARAQLGGLR